MTAEQIGLVSGTVVGIVQVIKAAGLAGKYGVLWSAAIAAIATGLFGWSSGDLSRATAFAYFVGWSVAFTSAAGVFGLINQAPELVTNIKGAGTALVQSLKGNGTGV